MKRAKIYLENIPGSPYSQSAKHRTEKKDRESHEDFEKRTWREKCTTTPEGQIAIPAMALKQALDTCAYKLGEKVPGRRGATYKNFFASGVLVEANVPIANGKILRKEDAEEITIWANSDGIRGSGKRVERTFPQFSKWHGVATVIVIDDIITQEVFERHAKASGMIVGIGRFRAEKGGLNGRYRVTKIEWEEISL